MKLNFRLFGYYYQSDNNKNSRFQTFKIPLRTNYFVFKIIFSCQGNFRSWVSENLGMMVHGMDSIHIQILQAKAHTKVLKLNLFSLWMSYLHPIAILASKEIKWQWQNNKYSLIVNSLYWMGFFLPVNAQISNEQFSTEIKLRSLNTRFFALKLSAKAFVALHLTIHSLYDNF